MNLIVSDFFKVKPSLGIVPKNLEVVVANPPYTRQEEMEYKDQIREEALSYSDGTKIQLDSRAGIYAYFFTHSSKFMKDHSMMGQITSDTWLDVGFGEDLKQFFLDHFKIHSILWYDIRAFERALVGTCITILEKEEESKESRDNNNVKFVRIKKTMPIERIITTTKASKRDFENERIGITVKKQSELEPKDKWGIFLRAPAIYFKLVSSPKMIRLKEIAEVNRGYTTGANEFFYLDKGKSEEWKIERQFLEPIITSPKNIKIELSNKDALEFVLMVHESKDKLGKYNVLKYIEQGENTEVTVRGGKENGKVVKGYHNLSTLKTRNLWYNLSEREPAPLLFSCKVWERFVVVLNKIKAQADKAFYEIRPKEDSNVNVLAGILNSSLTSLLAELHGRFYGGGVLELEIYECKDLPVLNPNKLSEKDKQKIEVAFSKVSEAQKKGDDQLEKDSRIILDYAVFDILKLSKSERQQVYEGLESLRNTRLQRKEVDVLVETSEKWKPHKEPKKERLKLVEPSKRLDRWMER
jgi:hypothetical protein